MMTNIYDQRNNIWELQTLLRDFSKLQIEVPLINPDGIFGPETILAVRIAQKILGFEETGIADYPTWRALFDSFDRQHLR